MREDGCGRQRCSCLPACGRSRPSHYSQQIRSLHSDSKNSKQFSEDRVKITSVSCNALLSALEKGQQWSQAQGSRSHHSSFQTFSELSASCQETGSGTDCQGRAACALVCAGPALTQAISFLDRMQRRRLHNQVRAAKAASRSHFSFADGVRNIGQRL